MVKIQKQQIGKDKTLIKLTSDTSRRDLIRNFWTYINYGNSVCIRRGVDIEDDTGLTFLDIAESEGYFTADTSEFIKTLSSIHLHKLTENLEGHIPKEMRDKAYKLGLNDWNKIEETDIFKNDLDEGIMLTLG